jgi:hypothetical protein
MPGVTAGDAALAPQNREGLPRVPGLLDQRKAPINLPLCRVILAVIAVREAHHERGGGKEQERDEPGSGHGGCEGQIE